ncbi:hypothetical protein HY500_00680 [Candidatus Woesearchaeota archaeon]|nr:hypothetical protein [Candidatus Woesearchaeota archaeon]
MYAEKRGGSGIRSELDRSFFELNNLFEKVKEEHKLTSWQLLRKLDQKELLIPVTIFSDKLSCLETVVKYLREHLGLSTKEISKLMKRSNKTIYQSYRSASEKFPGNLVFADSQYYIPLLFFSRRELSVLEHIVRFLHEECELRYSTIARMLSRDPRTIWTVYRRVVKKNDKK